MRLFSIRPQKKKVTALALVDISGDGVKALVVGSEDYEIRFYR